MTNKEAIKYLQQIYPNGGHCWLDEQRIEAIGMAINALQEEPVNSPIDFEQELYKAFGQVKDFTLGMRIAKWFYDIGKNSQEPVSEGLEEASVNYAATGEFLPNGKEMIDFQLEKAFKAGARWQKQEDQSTIELAEDHAYFAGRTKTIDEIKEALLSEVLPCFMQGGEADEVVAKLDEVLNQKK